MSKVILFNPVENPVPAKNKANPKCLNVLRHRGEIELMVGVFLKIHPTRSPTVNVQAVVPKEIDAILIVPKIFPKSAVRLIKINNKQMLLSISKVYLVDNLFFLLRILLFIKSLYF